MEFLILTVIGVIGSIAAAWFSFILLFPQKIEIYTSFSSNTKGHKFTISILRDDILGFTNYDSRLYLKSGFWVKIRPKDDTQLSSYAGMNLLQKYLEFWPWYKRTLFIKDCFCIIPPLADQGRINCCSVRS